MPLPRAGNSQETPIEEWVFEDFGTLNTKVTRPAVGETEFYWTQNLMPIATGRLRTLYAEGTTVYTASGLTVVYIFSYILQGTAYWAVFLSDGSAIQVLATSPYTTTTIAASGTFYSSSTPTLIPACAQFQNKYLAIVNTLNTSNYWLWDGTRLYGSTTTSGTTTTSLSPDYTILNGGTGYTSNPTVTVYGGGGTATATAKVKNGSVTELTISPGSGYALNDQPIIYFTGGGSDNQAVAVPVVSTTTGSVSAVTILNGGSGYTAASTITFSGTGGSGAAATITGLTSTGGGAITSIAITQGGSGYTGVVTATASVGTGAVFNVQTSSGGISSMTLVSGGSGYFGDPQVTIVGAGTGAVVNAKLNTTGNITGFDIVSPGKNYTSATSAVISGGNKSASATISLMPIGVSGTTVETYQNRVWIANGINFYATGANTVANFATSTGGVLAQITDNSLRSQITRLAQSSGYLYIFGDSSITVLTNVQTSTTGLTTYNLSNVDPQVGTSWRDCVTAFGRALIFANPSGVYALYGGSAEKVSPMLDGLFLKANWSSTTPTAAVATIYNIRVFMMNFTTVNPYTGATVTLMAMWDGQKWFVGTQNKQPNFIQTQEVNSVIQAWGTDGTNLYPMYQTASSTLQKVFQTKIRKAPNYTSFKRALRLYFVATNNGADSSPSFALSADTDASLGVPINLTLQQLALNFVNNSNASIQFQSNSNQNINFFSSPPVSIIGTGLSTYGRMIGYTLTTTASDLDIISFTTQFGEFAPFG
jgi:hypothetical protein